MNIQMKILKQVALETDNFRNQAERLGKIASEAFRNQKNQMKNLENIANTALKASDVLDYIKRQTGRANKNEGWKSQGLGVELINQIEDELAKARDRVDRSLGLTDEIQKLEVYLLIIREFIRQVVIHYEYKVGE